MNAKTVEVTVDAAGQVRVEAFGFAGAGCEQATQFLERALGRKTVQHRKPEYCLSRRTVAQSRRQQLGGNSP